MSDMLLKMTLSFNDAGSGPLAAFTDRIKALDGVIANVNARFAEMQSGLSNIVAPIGASSTSISVLEERITALLGSIATIETRLAGAAGAFVSLGEAAILSGSQIQAVGGKLAAANAEIAATSGHVNTLTTSLKGMAEMWSALEIKKGLLGSVHAAADYQTAQMQLKSFNMNPADETHALDAARKLADSKPYMTYTSSLNSRIAGIAGLGEPNAQGAAILDKVLPMFTTVANNLMRMGMKGNMDDNVRNLFAVMEARQITNDPAKMNSTAELLQKVVTGSGMKLNVQDFETVFRQMKYGTAQNITDEGIYKLLA